MPAIFPTDVLYALLDDRYNFNWRGTWSAIVNYAAGDIVTDGTTTYRALQASLNVPPVEGAVWTVMAQGAGVIGFATKAAMDAELDYAAGHVAFVTNDSTAENNGVYRKEGASGAGSWVVSSYDRITQLATAVEFLQTLVENVTGTDSDMSGPNNWVAATGSPTFDVNSTVAGKLYLDLSEPSVSKAIKLPAKLIVGKYYQVSITARLISGSPARVQLGDFSSNPGTDSFCFTPSSTETTFTGRIIADNVDIYLGITAADNTVGGTYSFDTILIEQITPNDYKQAPYIEASTDLLAGKEIITGTDSNMSGPNNWVTATGSPTFDVNSTVAGKLYMDLSTPAVSKAIKLPAKLTVGKYYEVSIAARLISGTAGRVQLGAFTTPPGGGALSFFPTGTETTFTGTIVATGVDVYLGISAADNTTGGTYSFDVVTAVQITPKDYRQDLVVQNINDLLFSPQLVTGTDSDMSGPNNWVTAIGSPTFDVNSTVAGKLYINLGTPSVSKAIKLPAKVVVGKYYEVSIAAQLISGTAARVQLGDFQSTPGAGSFCFVPTAAETVFTGSICASSVDIYLGIAGGDNLIGGTYSFDTITVRQIAAKDYVQDSNILQIQELLGLTSQTSIMFQTAQFMTSLSRYDKPLIKFIVAGDSLMANFMGGDIPVELDEGTACRPIRLDVNNIPRRIYDHISFDKATHRRLDHADWTRNGSWTTVNNTTIWEPTHDNDLYHTTSAANAYAEIVVPDGQENFALVFHQRPSQDATVTVTLNGGSIAAYGAASINLARANVGTGDIGNPYYTVQYLGLPAGNNTIRITKSNDSTEMRLWGGFWWSGVTLMVYNIGHGGHTMSELLSQGHLRAELYENSPDAVLFELTIMNEMSRPRTEAQSITDLNIIISQYLSGKDVMFMTASPFGLNPIDGVTNYYTTYPGQLERGRALLLELRSLGIPFVDVFTIFKRKVENRGGTLTGGEHGTWYTTDGMHPNEAGCREWFNMIQSALNDKPISAA